MIRAANRDDIQYVAHVLSKKRRYNTVLAIILGPVKRFNIQQIYIKGVRNASQLSHISGYHGRRVDVVYNIQFVITLIKATIMAWRAVSGRSEMLVFKVNIFRHTCCRSRTFS